LKGEKIRVDGLGFGFPEMMGYLGEVRKGCVVEGRAIFLVLGLLGGLVL